MPAHFSSTSGTANTTQQMVKKMNSSLNRTRHMCILYSCFSRTLLRTPSKYLNKKEKKGNENYNCLRSNCLEQYLMETLETFILYGGAQNQNKIVVKIQIDCNNNI